MTTLLLVGLGSAMGAPARYFVRLKPVDEDRHMIVRAQRGGRSEQVPAPLGDLDGG